MWGVDILFVVGGNGGNAGASAIQQKCAEAGVVCNVVGVPKSIDNDILLIGGRMCLRDRGAAGVCL
jgi:6-phosphofructokinase 1